MNHVQKKGVIYLSEYLEKSGINIELTQYLSALKLQEKEAEIKERAMLVAQTYVGPEEDYSYHLNLILDKFFKKQ